MKEKRCWKCEKTKSVSEFYKDRSHSDGLQGMCKTCTKERNRNYHRENPGYHKDWYHENKDEKEYLSPQYRYARYRDAYIERSKRYRSSPRGAMKTLLQSAKNRADKNIIEYDIDFEWLADRWDEQGGSCLLTGIEFQFEWEDRPGKKRRYRPYSPSLDKIDPDGGYTKDNVRLVCTAINIAMNQFGDVAFERLARAFIKHRETT